MRPWLAVRSNATPFTRFPVSTPPLWAAWRLVKRCWRKPAKPPISNSATPPPTRPPTTLKRRLSCSVMWSIAGASWGVGWTPPLKRWMSPSRKKRRLKRIRANRYGQSPNSQTHNPRYEHAALVGTGPRRGGHASDRVSEQHRLVRQRRDCMRPGVQLRCASPKSLVGGTRATLGVLGIFALRPDRRARVAGYATHEKLARTVEPDAGGSGNQRLPDACRPMAIRSGMSLVFGVPGIDGGNFRDAHISAARPSAGHTLVQLVAEPRGRRHYRGGRPAFILRL